MRPFSGDHNCIRLFVRQKESVLSNPTANLFEGNIRRPLETFGGMIYHYQGHVVCKANERGPRW